MATYAQFKHVELYKIGHGKNRVPNAPKSSISEIFNTEAVDGASPARGSPPRARVLRDTPTRPRDTHSRLFGQLNASPPAPMMTDTIRSHIQFGEEHCNGVSTPASNSPTKLTNGSASSTPSRVSYTPPRRNPVTGDGVVLPPPRRRHPASYRGADPLAHLTPEHVHTYLYDPIIYPQGDPTIYPLEPQPSHRYLTRDWPPRPGQYNVDSTFKPLLSYQQTPYSLLGLREGPHSQILEFDSDALSPQPILDRQCPPFPAQREFNIEPRDQIPYESLLPHSYVSMNSVLDDGPSFHYRRNPIQTFDGSVDPYVASYLNPSPVLFKYERDGPIPDVTLLQTPQAPGPSTLLGFPPTFHRHVPSYLFNKDRHSEEFASKTYYLDYARRRDMGGCLKSPLKELYHEFYCTEAKNNLIKDKNEHFC